ncbi:nucleotidyltransferase domain-containing protein [Corynebacterium casei]|uniref:Polymerase nucleotidyl transferase domain-containing protein n=1 Tax=Corynebacterium casei UCMA 3821 TaxID=1110505 RepID=G7HWJ1_9CORY|nr:nucleotidyltransferase domain-containing protein [Corynebacterium casei]CCE54556.1 putative uncharacterized protein [Corynebacterium casei UCMA 3821]
MEIRECIAAAHAVINEVNETENIDSAYIGGSIPAGLGNKSSDVDLFLLFDEDSIEGAKVQQFAVEGIRVDVERYSLKELHTYLDRIESIEITGPQLVELDGGLKEPLDWYGRLYASIELQTSSKLAELVTRSRSIELKARRIYSSYWSLFSDGYVEDFVGAVDSDDDKGSCIMASQQMVAMAAKSLLAAAGDFYYPPKWVYKQIDRMFPSHYALADFQSLQTGAWIDMGIPPHQVLLRVQTLYANAVLELFYPGSTSAILPRNESISPTLPRLYRVSGAVPFKADGGKVLLHFELQRQVTLSFILFLVWTLCDGRTQDEIIESVSSYLSREDIQVNGSVSDLVGKVLPKLQQSNLISNVGDY